MLKIISGKYSNFIIPTASKINYRPSTGKLKEAIFSIITSGEFIDKQLFTKNINVLDLFAGSGSLGFEALSRGAGFATFIDINANSLNVAKKFSQSLGLEQCTNFVNINALSLPNATRKFDLIFIDPPYYKDIVPKVVNLLIKHNWLEYGATLVIEMAKIDSYVPNNNKFNILREKFYGKSKLLILEYTNMLYPD